MANDTVMMIASSPGRLPGTGPGRQGSAEDLRTRGVYSKWPIHFTARVCSATVSPDHAGGVVADLPVSGTQPNSKYFNASEVKNGRVPPGTVAGTHGGTTMA